MIMKRVLILTSVASMIEQFNMPNIKLLQNMGYHVDVACNFLEGNTCSDEVIRQLEGRLREMHVNCYQIDFKRKVSQIRENVKAYIQVKELLNKNSYKLIHCHSPIGGVVGRMAGKRTKTKVIYTAHGFHFYKGAPLKNWLLFYPIEWICSYFTDVLICINKEDFELAQKKMKAKDIRYIPGIGIDIQKFNKNDRKLCKTEIRRELLIPDDAFVIVSLGELNQNKNHEIVIRAIAAINNPNIQYIIAGKGKLNDYLLELCEKLDIANQIFLLGFRSDNVRLLHAADVYALPSRREGLNVSLMEAMASRLPIICSKIRGNTDLVEDGKNGFFFTPEDSNKVQNAIEKMMKCDRKAMGEKSYEIIDNFSQEKVNQMMIQIYSLDEIG